MKPSVLSVVIPVFNKWELTADCLKSLREHTPGDDVEIIVADNASKDATRTDLEPLGASLFGPRFKRIRFEENRNFGPACNAGAKTASSDILFFLNNDTLLTPGWLPPLLRVMEQGPKQVVGPLLLYEDDTVQHLGVTFNAYGPQHLYAGFPREHPVVNRRRELQCITAAALMLRKDFFLAAEGFFEGFRNGFEDVDLCLRLKEAGARFTVEPDSVIYHLESQSPGRKTHEEANGDLLRSRCGRLVRIDAHRFFKEDGFLPFVTRELQVSACLRPEDEAFLTAKLETLQSDLPTVLQLVTGNPFWTKGREFLAHVLEQAGKYEEALDLRAQVFDLLQSEQSLLALVAAAKKAGNPAALTLALRNRREPGEAVRQKYINAARAAVVNAARHKDGLLQALFLPELERLLEEDRAEKQKKDISAE